MVVSGTQEPTTSSPSEEVVVEAEEEVIATGTVTEDDESRTQIANQLIDGNSSAVTKTATWGFALATVVLLFQ